MTTTTPDAVEALSDSLIDIDMCDLDGADYGTNALLAALKEKGFTIARAEPKPVKAEAPMPESVEKAIENITQKAFAACGTTQDARPFKKDRETIRAHIAAQQAEVERLRFAATNLLDNLHGLTKLQEVQHRAPTWMKAIENSADRLIAALNPEQKGG